MRTRDLLAASAVAAIAVGGLVATVPSAVAAPQASSGNCPDAKPVPGNAKETTVYAPDGKVIVGYCVKSAGAPGTTGAPETVTLALGVTSLVLKHSDGGNLTHYSLVLAPAPGATTGPTDEPTEPTVPTGSTENGPATTPGGAFDWDWTYEVPGCDGLVVAYPSNLPSGQSNDVNIRLETDQGEVTLNYHNNETTWSGTTGFVYSQHPRWPAGVTEYAVTWVQVGGTNYHWQGRVECGLGEVSPETGTRNGYARGGQTGGGVVEGGEVAVTGFRAGTTTVSRGQRVGNDLVSVAGLTGRTLELQRWKGGAWTRVSTVATVDGTAVVAYPKQGKRGTSVYRLATDGYASDVLTVTVR